jgi:hypothetical protein
MSLRQKDPAFFDVVHGGGLLPPIDEDEYSYGGGGHVPSWATHVVAFLFGGLAWGTFLLAPIAFPFVGLLAIVGLVLLAVRGRWR